MKITKQRLKQIIKEEVSALAEQTTGPDRWEQIFAGVISDKWWMASTAGSSHRMSAAAVARKELEKAIMESGALRTVTDLITSVEERLDNGEFDRDSSADTNQDGDVQWSELDGEQPNTDRESSAQEWRRIKRFTSDIRRLVNRALTSPPQRTPPPEPEEALENAIELTKMAAKEEFAPLVDKAAEEYKNSAVWKKILADFE